MIRIATFVLFVVAALVCAAPASAQIADLSWRTVDCGGGTSAGGNLTLLGAIAQPDAGVMTGLSYTLSGGFLPGINTGPAPLCEGDTNNSGAIDVDDLVAVILAWGGCPGCPPSHCPQDVAPFPGGNCAIDVDDLLSVILHWGPCH
jgi:hypothetical protein